MDVSRHAPTQTKGLFDYVYSDWTGPTKRSNSNPAGKMNTFPEFSDEDDEFLPFPDDDNEDSDGWPEFDEREWRNFSRSRIVSITAIPLDEDIRRDPSNILSLSTMAVSSMAVSSMAEGTVEPPPPKTPTSPTTTTITPNKMKRLRKKLPMLLCKSSRIKQSSPGDKHVRFVHHSEEEEEGDSYYENGDIILPRREDFVHERQEKQDFSRPIYQETRDIILPRHLEIFQERPQQQVSRPYATAGGQELCFQGFSPVVEPYSGGKASPSNWIATANLFHDKTLFPSNTLDFFCRDSALAKMSNSSEEESVSSSSSSNAPSLPGGVVDEKLAHVFGLFCMPKDKADKDFSTLASKGSSFSRTILNVPATSIAHGATEGNASSESGPRVPEKTAAAVKSFTNVRPNGSKVADRQGWQNGAFNRPEVNKDSLLTDTTKEMSETSSNVTGNKDSFLMDKGTGKVISKVTGMTEAFGNDDSFLTDVVKLTDKASSNVTEMSETFGNKDSLPKNEAKRMPETSLKVRGIIEAFGNKDTLLTDKIRAMDKASSNVTETSDKFGNKDSVLKEDAKVTPKTSLKVKGMIEAFVNKDSVLADKVRPMDKASSNVTETSETFGNKESLLKEDVKVTPKTSSTVTVGNKGSLLKDKVKVTLKTSSRVTAMIEALGNKDSLLADKVKAMDKAISNVTEASEKFGNKGSLLKDEAKVTPKMSSTVTVGNQDSLLKDKAKVKPKTSSRVTAMIEAFGTKDSLLLDTIDKASPNVTETSENFGNEDSLRKVEAKVTPKTSSTVTGTIEKFGGKMIRQSTVQLRKQELECKLSLKNEGKPCVQTRWEGRPGAYKKKVVLSTYGY